MSSSTLVLGQLVEILDSTEPVGCPQQWRQMDPRWSDEAKDVRGQRGQLLERSDATGHWLVATFDGSALPVRKESVRGLSTKEMDGFDLVIGLRSNHSVMGKTLLSCLQRKGHALCKFCISDEDLQSMSDVAEKCLGQGRFARLPLELEPAYLGTGGRAKTMLLDMETTDAGLKNSALRAGENAFALVGQVMKPLVGNEFGIDICGRTSTLLTLPFDDDEHLFESPICDHHDAEELLTMMRRARFMAIVNAGPGAATLRLTPKLNDSGGQAESLSVSSGMVAVFETSRFEFAYETDKKALTMSSWYLDVPGSLVLSDMEGDFSNTAPIMVPQGAGAEQVAVVSMGTRYAYGIDVPWKLWVTLSKGGLDTFQKIPPHRWDLETYANCYEEDADGTSGKSYTCHCNMIEGVDLFDCKFFEISPLEARGMDPNQRHILETSYIALENGGFSKKELQKKPGHIGFFVGCMVTEWGEANKEDLGAMAGSSHATSIMSNRFNYTMNLKGPSMTIDTACSSSLVAMHTAKVYLRDKQFDPLVACIATGVNITMGTSSFVACCAAGMLSHKGRCFTFDGSADGYARGEGIGSACLKLKNFDKEDGDFAVLAGSNVNQDGKTATLTAPNGPSQEKVSQAVLREAGITPAEVDATECHGTGTPLGDPIEVGAYRKAMSRVERNEPVLVTSSKTNFGHCEGTAGITGFLKCVLMCMHTEATPNCHLVSLNPHLDVEGFPCSFLTEGVVERGNSVYNGVMSMGFGGTNAGAQCWCHNTMTSRGAPGDPSKVLLKQLKHGSPMEINMNSENWQNWKVDRPESQPNMPFEVQIHDDGTLTYVVKEKAQKDHSGDSYCITGTFNGWSHDRINSDSEIVGLHAGVIQIGSDGEEQFQVSLDNNRELAFYPQFAKCWMKSAPVKGPASTSKDIAWCIRGAPGDKFRIEFYRSDSGEFSISWSRQSS